MGPTLGATTTIGRWGWVAGVVLLMMIAARAVVWRAPSTGPLVRTVAVGRHPLAVAVAARAGRIFVANSGSNSVSVLDARSGALLRAQYRLALSPSPWPWTPAPSAYSWPT